MKILVIGDSCTDVFIYGHSTRMCPEAPVPIFEPSRTVTNDGMAGNVRANLESLGANVNLITNKEQITKTRYVDVKSNQMFLRVDSIDRVRPAFDINRVDWDVDAVIVSDMTPDETENLKIQLFTNKQIDYDCIFQMWKDAGIQKFGQPFILDGQNFEKMSL